MKRYITLFLILILLVLAGCTTDPEPTIQPSDQPQTSAFSTIQTQAVTEPQTTAALPETTTAAPVYYPNDITHGFVTDNVYICGFLGLNYLLPEGQTFWTDAELAQTQGFDAETITDEDMARVIGETNFFVDMQTSGPADSDPYVHLAYQDLRDFGPVSDAADYFEKSKDISLLLIESSGFTDASFEVEDYYLDGVKCASAVIRFTSDGTETYQRMVGVMKDHYVAMLTATGSDESADELLQGFHWMQS